MANQTLEVRTQEMLEVESWKRKGICTDMKRGATIMFCANYTESNCPQTCTYALKRSGKYN